MAELIVGQVVSLSGQAVDQLLSRGDGDAALFCLALLRHSDAEKARASLRWTTQRADQAWRELAKMGLVAGEKAPEPETRIVEAEGPPEYLRADILGAMEGDGSFRSLCQAVERRLGKKLSDADLKSLFEIYDYLALPVEVILLLITRCSEEYQEKYGPGRTPKMPMIKKMAYMWRRMGVDTAEAAEEYLKNQSRLRVREREILPLLDITGRTPLEKEREYLDAWVDMGFPNESIRLAYERTVMKKQALNWPYMNSILKSWHSKGLHTPGEISAGDSAPAREKIAPKAARAVSDQDMNERLRQDMAWLEQFAKQNERG